MCIICLNMKKTIIKLLEGIFVSYISNSLKKSQKDKFIWHKKMESFCIKKKKIQVTA